MRYIGGKNRIAKKLAELLESKRDERVVLEPFCGALWVTVQVGGSRIATDISSPLIAMYKALQEGWQPPEAVSFEDYKKARELRDDDPLKAFIGYGRSWGGKWFGGYARDSTGRNYAKNAKNSLLGKMQSCSDVKFECKSYDELNPYGMLIYCDPPYEGTTAVGERHAFDHKFFWETMREWSESNTVLISEFNAPDDFTCIEVFSARRDIRPSRKNAPRCERIFMYSGSEELLG